MEDVFSSCLCIVFKKSRSEFKEKQWTCKEFQSLAVPRKKTFCRDFLKKPRHDEWKIMQAFRISGIPKMRKTNQLNINQKQPLRGVLEKRCSENIQKICTSNHMFKRENWDKFRKMNEVNFPQISWINMWFLLNISDKLSKSTQG